MYPNLNAELSRNNKGQVDIAKALNLRKATISDKMSGKNDWKLSECKKIILNVLPGYTIDYLFSLREK